MASMQPAPTITTKVTAFLASPKDWDNWFAVTKSYATLQKVWHLVDPKLDDEPVLRREPREPEPADVRRTTTTTQTTSSTIPTTSSIDFLDLTAEERSAFEFIYKRWQSRKADYEKEQQGLANVHSHLLSTVSADHITPLLSTNESLYSIMVTLKDNFCLSTEGRQQSVLERYYALKRFPKNEDLCFWVDKWIRIERDLKSAGLRELDSIKRDFYEVNKKVDPFYAAGWSRDWKNATFKDMTKEFRQHYMENPRPVQQQSSHSAFQATLQRRDQDGNKIDTANSDRKVKGSKREKREDLDCPCGLHKNIEKCSYIFPSLRNPGWTEDPEIRKKIDLKIESNNRLAKLVEHLQREASKRGKKAELPDSSTISVRDKAAFMMSTITTAFIGSTQQCSAYELYRSFIADNGADTHLINQVYRDRMTNFRPAGPDLHVRSGPELSSIVGIGDAWFLARDRRGELGRFWLKDVIFVPDFPTNLVSLTRAKAAGLGFDTYKEELYNARTGEILATTQYLYNQDVFEYHDLEDGNYEPQCNDTIDPDPTAFAAARRNTTPTSMMSPHSAGTLQLWRQRFGYVNDQTIRHLPDVARGVEITDLKTSRLPRGEPKPLDEAYELANPKQQISRRRPDPRVAAGRV
jgi:hypothetical protein